MSELPTLNEFFQKRLREIGLYDKDSDYGGLIGKWVEELSQTFANQGHSGMSAEVTVEVFNQLMNEWMKTSFGSVTMRKVMKGYQVDRESPFFIAKGGSIVGTAFEKTFRLPYKYLKSWQVIWGCHEPVHEKFESLELLIEKLSKLGYSFYQHVDVKGD